MRILRSWTCCPKSVTTVPADLVICTLKQEKLPQKLDTRATSLLQKIQFRQCRMPHRRATSTLQRIKAQKARMVGNLHSVAGETMHGLRAEKIRCTQARQEGILHTTAKRSGNEAGGHFQRSSRQCLEDKMLQEVSTWVPSALQKSGSWRQQAPGLAPRCRKSNAPETME